MTAWRLRRRAFAAEMTAAPALRAAAAAAVPLAMRGSRTWKREVAADAIAGMSAYLAWSQAAYRDRQIRNIEDMSLLSAVFGRNCPSFGIWAIEADLGRVLADELERRPRLVVELGSGASTVLIAGLLHRHGTGQLISIEHDRRFADATAERVQELGLGERVRIVLAPLRRQLVGTTWTSWYDADAVLDAMGDTKIDLLLVDGPPAVTRWSRWPAIEVLGSRLAEDGVVLADDGRNRWQRATALRWAHDHHDLRLYWLDTLKGTWRIEVSSAPESDLKRMLRRARRRINPTPVGFARWAVPR